MRRALPILSILCFTVALTGCIAAGAGAVAGDAAVTPSEEAIAYVRSHDLEPYIGRAIERGDVVRGMSEEDVRFVEGEPNRIQKEGSRTVWIFETVSFDRATEETRIYFEKGKVVDIK